MIRLAENVGNFPLNTLRVGHAVGEARLHDALTARAPVQGGTPVAPSPPRGARGPAPSWCFALLRWAGLVPGRHEPRRRRLLVPLLLMVPWQLPVAQVM